MNQINDLKLQEIHDLRLKDVLFYFLGGALLVAISDIPNNWGVLFYAARGFLVILLLATFVISQRYAIILLLMLASTGLDIVSSGYGMFEEAGYTTASIWRLHFGPIHAGYIMFGCIFWQLFRIQKITVHPFVLRAIVWFSTVPFAAAVIYGGFLTENARIEAVVDVRFALMLIISIILFISFFKKYPQYFNTLLVAFIGALLARHMMDFIYVIANIGPEIAQDVSRGSEDSAKGAVVLLTYLGMVLILTKRHILIGGSLVISSVFLLVAYGTRNLWITFILGLLVLMYFLELRKNVKLILIGAVLMIAGIWLLFLVNPTTAEIIYARSKTFIEDRPAYKYQLAAGSNILTRIEEVRYAQILNVFDSLNRRYAWFWGTGYGGYYEDKVIPFPNVLQSAFAEYSFQSGEYYRAHEFNIQTFLKFGFLGWLVIVSLWFVPGYALFKIFKSRNMFAKDQPIILNSVMICIVAFLPTGMLQTSWSSKGLLINGMIIASCMAFAWKNQITPLTKQMFREFKT